MKPPPPTTPELALKVAHQGLYDLDVQTGEALVSDEYATMLGYDPATFTETHQAWLDRLHPDDREVTEAVFQAHITGKRPVYQVEFRQRTREGAWKWILSLGHVVEWSADGQPLRMVGTHTDITALKEAQHRLRDSELAYRQLFDSMMDGFATHEIILDTAGRPVDYRFLTANPAFEAVTGLRAAHVVGRTFREVFPDGESKWIERYGHVALTGEPLVFEDYAPELDKFVSVKAFRTAPGQFAVVFADTTARHRALAEAALHSAALNASADAIIITNVDGITQWVNDAMCALSGYAREELVGRSIEMLKSDVLPQSVHDRMWQQLRSGIPWSGEFVNRRKDGSLYTEASTMTPVRNAQDEVTHYVAIKRDITEKERLRSELLHSQKMEVVGRLAGSVAHDFNNLLGVITGTADVALRTLGLTGQVRNDLETIRVTAERGAVLTRQLLVFSRREVLNVQPVDLNQAVTAMEPMLSRLVGETIAVSVRAMARRSTIQADASHVEQVILNLVVNARDAMPAGGTITISTRDGVDHVILAVADTGSGMSPDVRARIFEPFFTTKDPSHGTGLGLSTVGHIVKSSGATIRVDTKLGEGSTFTVVWPRTDEPVTTGPDAARSVTDCNPARILLVEDDEPLRRLTARMLRDAGHEVVTAASAEDALGIIDAEGSRVDLLLTDVVLPGLSGPALEAHVRRRHPTVRVLFVSGYPNEEFEPIDSALVGSRLVRKPFSSAELLARVAAVLQTNEAGGSV